MTVPLGEAESVKLTGATAAGLLAGFSLATIAVLVTAGNLPPLADWAIAALTVAAVSFVFAVQFTAAAVGYAATPDERLMWQPVARTDPEEMENVLRVQRMDIRLQGRYFRRARFSYRCGTLAYLTGILLMLVPEEVTLPRSAALGVVSVALVLEAVWLFSNALRRYPRQLLPSYGDPDVWEEPRATG